MQVLKFIAVAICALALLAAGCGHGRAVHNVDGLVVTPKANPSADEVAKAIIRAGGNSFWRITEAGPGQLVGNRVQGPHTAMITINYTPKTYQIALKESSMQDGRGGVHQTYNLWVQQLDNQIKFQLGGI
jgi:hypothetical protein